MPGSSEEQCGAGDGADSPDSGRLRQSGQPALGPLIAGRIFDLTGSYTTAFELFIVMQMLAAVAAFACLPLSVEQSRVGEGRLQGDLSGAPSLRPSSTDPV
jgi:hypothetical protein